MKRMKPSPDLLEVCEAAGITFNEALTDYIKGAKLSERMRLLEVYNAQGADALLVALREGR